MFIGGHDESPKPARGFVNCSLCTAKPKRLTSISTDGGYAFDDGSSTGIPVGELTKQEKPLEHTPAPLPNNHAMRQDIFSLAEGTVTIQMAFTTQR